MLYNTTMRNYISENINVQVGKIVLPLTIFYPMLLKHCSEVMAAYLQNSFVYMNRFSMYLNYKIASGL